MTQAGRYNGCLRIRATLGLRRGLTAPPGSASVIVMTRSDLTSTVIALWAFVAMPALCTVGVVEHACSCCPDSHVGHESQCESDPCSQLVVREDDAANAASDPAPVELQAPLAPTLDTLACLLVEPHSSPPDDRPSWCTFRPELAHTVLLI